jgi:hypothetical protein
MADMVKSFLSSTLDPLLQSTGNIINLPLLYGGLVLYLVVILHVLLPDQNTQKNWTSTKTILYILSIEGILYLPIAGAIYLRDSEINYVNFALVGAGLYFVSRIINNLKKDQDCESLSDPTCDGRVARLGAGTADFVEKIAAGFLYAAVIAYVRQKIY